MLLRDSVLGGRGAQDPSHRILLLSKDPGHWQAPPKKHAKPGNNTAGNRICTASEQSGLTDVKRSSADPATLEDITVQLRILKHAYLTPCVRLRLYHLYRPVPGWLAYLRPGVIRSTLDRDLPGLYLFGSERLGGDRPENSPSDELTATL
jgi:hypothetical protein